MFTQLAGKILHHVLDRIVHAVNLSLHKFGLCGGLRKSQFLSAINDIDEYHFTQSAIQNMYTVSGVTREALSAEIERTLNHSFSLLGSSNKSVEVTKVCSLCFRNSTLWNTSYAPIEWHRDNLTNLLFLPLSRPTSCLNEYHRRAIEIKWPWELSRVQHLPLLGVLSQISNCVHQIHAAWRQFQLQTLDWIYSNPYGLGVNWACPMDVGIRAVNFLSAYVLFQCQYDFPNKWSDVFFRSISKHLQVLRRSLKASQGNNHATAEAASLYIACALLPAQLENRIPMDKAKQALHKQIARQIRQDGTQFEGSVYYHLFTFEMWLYPAIIGSCIADDFSDEYRRILGKMYAALKSIVSSQFELPQIGDRDDGFLLKPLDAQSDAVRLRHLFRLADRYLAGTERRDLRLALCDILLPDPESASLPLEQSEGIIEFRDSGWIVLRQRPWQVVVSTGALSRESSGHEHNDTLSFTLYAHGLGFIVDPGTYRYTSDLSRRREFRSTVMHNQPQFVTSAKSPSERCFAHFVRPTLEYMIHNEDRIFLEFKSWLSNTDPPICRNIRLYQQENKVAIEDVFERAGTARIALCLHPEVECSSLDASTYLLRRRGQSVKLQTESFSFSMQKGPYSPTYGHLTETVWLVFESPIQKRRCLWNLVEVLN